MPFGGKCGQAAFDGKMVDVKRFLCVKKKERRGCNERICPVFAWVSAGWFV